MSNSQSDRFRKDPDDKSFGAGNLFIISAPSGTGKTTLARAVLKRFSDMLFSVSYTTRKPRTGEKHGNDYYFISKEDFIDKIHSGQWAEWARVHGNLYGTSSEFLDKNLACGKNILLDIDVYGTEQILKRYPESITIFIMPPDIDTLKIRLESRGTDSKSDIARRIAQAEEEIKQKSHYRHIIVNGRLPAAVEELISIIGQYIL